MKNISFNHMKKRFGHVNPESPGWMFSEEEFSYARMNLEGEGTIWVPKGDDTEMVHRALGQAVSSAMSLTRFINFSRIRTNRWTKPIIVVVENGNLTDTYVTNANRQPLVVFGMDLARGFEKALRDIFTDPDDPLAKSRISYCLSRGLEWLLFHELAHLGFGHFEEDNIKQRSELRFSEQNFDNRSMLELYRVQEAEADLWATHALFQTVANQYYQIFIEPGQNRGRPFSDHIIFTLVVLFSYLNRQVLSLDAVRGAEHPHPQVRASLVNWYALKISERFDYFFVDWHTANREMAHLTNIFEYRKLPNVLLTDNNKWVSNIDDEINLMLKLLRERQDHFDVVESFNSCRLDL